MASCIEHSTSYIVVFLVYKLSGITAQIKFSLSFNQTNHKKLCLCTLLQREKKKEWIETECYLDHSMGEEKKRKVSLGLQP